MKKDDSTENDKSSVDGSIQVKQTHYRVYAQMHDEEFYWHLAERRKQNHDRRIRNVKQAQGIKNLMGYDMRTGYGRRATDKLHKPLKIKV